MDSDLAVYAKGKAFQDGVYDLRSFELVVGGYRSILDRLVAVLLGRRHLPEKAKRQLNYNVKVKNGSIELLIDFALDHPEFLGALVEGGGYQLSAAITKLYRDAITLRKAAASLIEKGIKFEIRISNSFNFGSHNTNVVVQDSEIIIPEPKILFAAQATRPPTDKVLRKVDGAQIEKIDLISDEETFTLDSDKRTILGRDKQILPARMKILGRLDMVAFSAHRGAIVSDSERYPVTWNEEIRSKMQRAADRDGVLFTVQPIIDHSRLDTDAIGFHVLDCEDPQQRINF